jgi:hypothetical protein
VLVPARLLVNGATIVQDTVDAITYFHIELPERNVILAQGLSCESYLNTGDRSAFANGGGAVALHPNLSTSRWEGLACADLVLPPGPPPRAVALGTITFGKELWEGPTVTDQGPCRPLP